MFDVEADMKLNGDGLHLITETRQYLQAKTHYYALMRMEMPEHVRQSIMDELAAKLRSDPARFFDISIDVKPIETMQEKENDKH